MRTNSTRVVTLATVLSALLAAAPASAQYFGRNKVQYKDLKFQVLKTEHFDIYFYQEEKAGVDISARLAERWYARLSRILAHRLRGRQPLVLDASHPDFEQTNVIQGELGEGTGGVTEPLRRRIVLPLGGPLADTDHVIDHELVHAFQFDMTTGPNSPPGQSGASDLPLWFIEGMAEYLSIGPVDPNTAMWLRDAAQQEKLPSIDKLEDPQYFPYRWGQAFWAYVGGRWGDQVVRQMAPDGHAIAFTGMSQGLTDLYVYDLIASTLRRLTNDAYADLQPAWSPDGRRIAFATDRFSTDLQSLAIGTYRLALVDVESGTIDSLPVFADASVLNPQWSPDGTLLYFISNRDGVPNFFRLALSSAEIAQLTNVATGLSGITSSSPAMSVAVRSGIASFSVYEGGKYNIYVVDSAARSASSMAQPTNAAVLPPTDRRPSDVAALLANTTLGLPGPVTYPTTGYAPKLSLEGLGQPVIAIGASRFGAAFGGGVSRAGRRSR